MINTAKSIKLSEIEINILINDKKCDIIPVMKQAITQKSSSLILRISLLGIAAVVLFFSSFMVAEVHSSWASEVPELAGWRYPIILVTIAVVVTFLVALAQIWKLLSLVDKNKAFSQGSVKVMRNVKYCGFIISGLFATWLPLSYHAALSDDAPGIILIFGTIFVGIPFVVAVLAGVAQKLFQNAIDIKSENDLTV